MLVIYVMTAYVGVAYTGRAEFFPATFSSKKACTDAGWAVAGKLKKRFDNVQFECIDSMEK